MGREKTETNIILIKKEIGLLSQDKNSINEKFSAVSIKVEGF
jgi:hypothetical protein